MTLPDKKNRKSSKGVSTGAQTPQRRSGTGSFTDAKMNRNYTEEPGAGTYDSSLSNELQESNPIIGQKALNVPSQMEMS